MRERERLEDFRGGHVACRGCKRLIMFAPGERMQVQCCGLLYSPEYGPMDLVIYDRLEPGDTRHAQVMPAPEPLLVAPSDDEVGWFGGEPEPPDPDDEPDEEPDEDRPQEPLPFPPDEEEDTEVAAMLASPEAIAARKGAREEQVRRRGPRYD